MYCRAGNTFINEPTIETVETLQKPLETDSFRGLYQNDPRTLGALIRELFCPASSRTILGGDRKWKIGIREMNPIGSQARRPIRKIGSEGSSGG